jgi:hypothetical protein
LKRFNASFLKRAGMNCFQRKFMFAFEMQKKKPSLSLNPLVHEVRGRIPQKGGGIKVKTFLSRDNLL